MGYPLTDGRVNVRLSTNATQQVTSTNQPDAFGISSVTAGTASAYSYGGAVGYRQDGIAPAGLPSAYGFQKVGARYYDPASGAFLTRDTDLSQKPYAYCYGDPVNFSDPSGHDSVDSKSANGHMEAVSGWVLFVGGVTAIALAPAEVPLVSIIIVAVVVGVVAGALINVGQATINASDEQEEQEKREAPDRPMKSGGVPGAVGDTNPTGAETIQHWEPNWQINTKGVTYLPPLTSGWHLVPGPC